ncbi:hypothetical protein KIW84_075160 [Lathyrus oleraceus]|uniref:Uncharacterized protein n=1 Tax=Pisum sativum TaxID=3888 RepID=A0A9D4VVY5_PEA|nr:hypothetical protein KIW84_075160 [Pisum sativum]
MHILDLETMIWDEIDAVGVPPSPRSDHAAAICKLWNGLAPHNKALYEIAMRDLFKDRRNSKQLEDDGLAPRNPSSGLPFQNAVQSPDTSNENYYPP